MDTTQKQMHAKACAYATALFQSCSPGLNVDASFQLASFHVAVIVDTLNLLKTPMGTGFPAEGSAAYPEPKMKCTRERTNQTIGLMYMIILMQGAKSFTYINASNLIVWMDVCRSLPMTLKTN